MRKLFYLGVLVAGAWLWFYPFAPDSRLQGVQSGLKAMADSETKDRETLARKQAQLAHYEKSIVDITTDFENAKANAPICPRTGLKVGVTMSHDPRPDLSRKCDTLRVEIGKLEKKLAN